MERIIRDNLISYLFQHKLLNVNQHGFMYAKSCATNLIESFDIITDALSDGYGVITVFLDFAKAFDKVCHSLLLVKLKAYGLGPEICNWIDAFLSNRKQRVVIGKYSSNWLNVLSGVPQGSVLGPLLFLVYINDLPSLAHHFCKLFADDTKLIAVIKDSHGYFLLQDDIYSLVEWSHKWKMSFNEEKCKVMFFGEQKFDQLNCAFVWNDGDSETDPNFDTDPHGRHYRFKMNNVALYETVVERDLGILVDNKLNWSNQINHAKSKAYAALGNLKRSFVNWTPYTFKILFSTFVRPHLEYCASVWSPQSSGEISGLELVQKRATKGVPALRSLHYQERLIKLNLTSLEQRRIRGDLIQFFKIIKGYNKIEWVKPLISCPSVSLDCPAGGVRGGSHRLAKLPISRCSARENFFYNRAINWWNQLPASIINSNNVNSFKNNLDNFTKSNPSFFNCSPFS